MPRDVNTGRRRTKKEKQIRNKELSGKYNKKAVRVAEAKATNKVQSPTSKEQKPNSKHKNKNNKR